MEIESIAAVPRPAERLRIDLDTQDDLLSDSLMRRGKPPRYRLICRRIGEQYGDDIEAHLLPWSGAPGGEFTGDAGHMGALFGSDGAFGRAVFAVLARLHFDDGESIAIPSDDVSFAIAGAEPIVAGDDDVALALKITVREILPPAPECAE